MFFKKELANKIANTSANKKRILSNVAWATGGKIVNMAGALFVAIVVARYLGPEQYGTMNYVISYVALFMVLSEFGLPNIEIRELAAHTEEKNEILGTCLGIRLCFAVITYTLIFVTLLLSKTDSHTLLLILIYAFSLFSNVFTLVRNYFTSIVKNEYVVKSEIFRTLIGAVIKVMLVMLGSPLEWFIVAVLFDTVLVSSGYVLSYQRIVGKISDWRFERTRVKYLVSESFPLVLSGAAVIIYQRIDQVMIGNMIDKTSVGYFATAEKFLSLILFLPGILTQTITPILVKTKESNDIVRYERMKRQMVSIVVWCSIAMAFIVSASSYWLVRLTYGREYLMAVPVLQIMAWKTVGAALSSSSGQIIIMEHKQKWAVIRNGLACLTCIAMNYIMIPKYGIIGSAWVTIITIIVASYLSNIFIPPYHSIFRLQCYALFCGWKEVFKLKDLRK